MSQDGIFTQHGPDGIFGRGGPPEDASSPPIDGDGTPLRETLVVVYPSPGHMRVARAIRHPKSGKVEFQEQYRVPTPEEAAFLKQQGITLGPGSMVTSQLPPVSGLGDAAAAAANGGVPWVKLGVAVALGAAGFWAVNKWVVPMFGGDDEPTLRTLRTNTFDDDDDDE
jgi:hypothetical protein